MNWIMIKRHFPALGLAAVLLASVWNIPAAAFETEDSGTVNYGSPENGEEYDFTEVEPIYEEADVENRYTGGLSEGLIKTRDIIGRTELTVNIRKRAEWTEEDTGGGKVTLQYASNSGAITGTKDMNIILIQDKSGSMDSNYGFRIQLEYENQDVSDYQALAYFPIRNSNGWTEAAEEIVEENVGNRNYVMNLNYTGDGFREGYIYSNETGYNSPCQMAEHYYLLAYDDEISGNTKATFIHGNNLYNIANTDFHHYRLLSSRDEALGYLNAGRRVIRAKKYCDENGVVRNTDEYYYFLDISKLFTYHGNQYLSTVDTACEKNDRLSRTQEFMSRLTEDIRNLNQNNRIAYIPFWGDVPKNGSWSNLSSNGSNNGLIVDTYLPQITVKKGTDTYDFQPESKFGLVLEQIRNPFTYNGTNWSKAFDQALTYLNKRDESEKVKDTLIVFMTDGMPQGFAGEMSDVDNPAINGESQIEKLKNIDGVNIYACGVCINQQDKTVKERMNRIDSSGTAAFARTTNQFDELAAVIENRIQEEYEEIICGKDAFYMDKLSDEFLLDEKKLDQSWVILEEADVALVKGVPANVYQAVESNSRITHVYVKSTKTVYWYIKELTDGTYDTTGHTCTFPVKYSGYDLSTAGNRKTLLSNQKQKLTYVSSANENQVLEVTTETPALLFNRQSPVITIEKKLEGSDFKTDQTFYFACAKTKQIYKVEDAVKTASVRVTVGNVTGKTIINDIEPGTYYVYETDKEGVIISPDEKCVTVGTENSILTLVKSTTVPASATASDGFSLENLNNYLQIKAINAEVSFINSYTSLKGEKIWDDNGASKRPSAIMVNLYCGREKIDSAEVSEKTGWKFCFDNLPETDHNGKLYDYTVTEEPVKNYESLIEYEVKDNGKYAYITNRLLSGDLTVIKKIKSGEEDIWWEHGNPTFVIKVSGVGTDGKEYTFFHTYEFTREYVRENQKNGMVTISYTFKDVPISEEYKIEEMCISRYKLESIKGNGDNVMIREGITGRRDAFFAMYASVNLQKRPEGTEVELYNEKQNYGWYGHNAYVENKIQLADF